MSALDNIWTNEKSKTQNLENMIEICQKVLASREVKTNKPEMKAGKSENKTTILADFVQLLEKYDKNFDKFMCMKKMENKQIVKAEVGFISDFVEMLTTKTDNLSRITQNFHIIEDRIDECNRRDANFLRVNYDCHEHAVKFLDFLQSEVNGFDSEFDNLEKVRLLREKYFTKFFDNSLNSSLKLDEWLGFVESAIKFHVDLNTNIF
jgi:hypothetical protein